MITIEEVREKLKTVIDPELGVNIVDLGLIYNVAVNENNEVKVEMTLTSPGCPLAPVIDSLIRSAISDLKPTRVQLELVWDPPWVPAMMSEEVKAELGIED